jgi:DNA-binding PucR family transcriptional regulator
VGSTRVNIGLHSPFDKPEVEEAERDHRQMLHEYLRTGSNQHLAARNLYIHRNTMAYRVDKIAEITGLDLEDGDTRFRLYLSYKIKELTTQRMLEAAIRPDGAGEAFRGEKRG